MDHIVGGYIIFDKTDIISSYFFDKENNKNITYAEIKSLEIYFKVCGTCTLYLKKVQIGIELRDVLLLISSDQLRSLELNALRENLNRLISHVIQLCKCCEIPNWIMGYEPAQDNDMKIIEWK